MQFLESEGESVQLEVFPEYYPFHLLKKAKVRVISMKMVPI